MGIPHTVEWSATWLITVKRRLIGLGFRTMHQRRSGQREADCDVARRRDLHKTEPVGSLVPCGPLRSCGQGAMRCDVEDEMIGCVTLCGVNEVTRFWA